MTRPPDRETANPSSPEAGFHWYATPVGVPRPLPTAPRPASWDRSDHPAQTRLRDYLDAVGRVAEDPPGGAWALRLDVGIPEEKALEEAPDLDNYALPLARRLDDQRLVSVWCTKRHATSSTITIGPAVRSPEPGDAHRVRVTASLESMAFKRAVRDAVAGQHEVPDGPVALEVAFCVGGTRNWLNLWKPTIDALDPLLGRTIEGRDWHPRDGRVVSLGLHVRPRDDTSHAVDIAVSAAAAHG